MPQPPATLEEYELPGIEAVLAGTLVLMTGYSQALQAAVAPQHRLKMGVGIADTLSILVDHPQLSPGFRQVLLGLQRRWQAMSECTRLAAQDRDSEASGRTQAPGGELSARFQLAAPKRLQ